MFDKLLVSFWETFGRCLESFGGVWGRFGGVFGKFSGKFSGGFWKNNIAKLNKEHFLDITLTL